MTKTNNDTNEVIYLQCDIGYINLRKGFEKTHIDWTGSKENPQWSGGTNLRPIFSGA